MLMQSALACDSSLAQPKPQRAPRPKLPSFDRYDPRQRSQSPIVGLIASCRALHGILGERFSASPSPSLEMTSRAKPMSSPFGHPSPPPVRAPPPRGVNKRSRDDSDDEEEEPEYRSQYSLSRSSTDSYSTPKRQRRVPLELPPGLQAADFEALADTIPGPPKPLFTAISEDIEMPTPELSEPSQDSEEPPTQGNTWTENDDRLLVQTVLNKLHLSSRDWNDCASQLGKDEDSIGRRWRLLLGTGNVGLRRGSGRQERPDLDIKSW